MKIGSIGKFLVGIVLSHHAVGDVSDPYLFKVSEYFTNLIQYRSLHLHDFLFKMPKGGDLHIHLGGAAYPQWLVSYAKNDVLNINWCVHKPDYNTTIDNNCVNDGGILLRTMLSSSSEYKEILAAWSMDGFPLVPPMYGHDHFFGTFQKSAPLLTQYVDNILPDLMFQAAEENILYLEPMIFYIDKNFVKNYAKYITVLPDNPEDTTYYDVISAIKQLEQHDFTNMVVKNYIINNSQLLLSQTRKLLGCNLSTPPKACNVAVKFQCIAYRNALFAEVLTVLFMLDSRLLD